MHVAGKIVEGHYVDSIALMRIADEVRRMPAVTSATIVLATPANRQLLLDTGAWPRDADGAGPEDLVIAVVANSKIAAHAAVERAESLLMERPPDAAVDAIDRPRSIIAAARIERAANLAVIAVPGRHAVAEAHQALTAGLHVFLFSDGVSLADEIELKRRARAHGRLVMGPECGTSLINGVGLGFANVVRRGAVGLVGASGTGIQEITTLIHRLGGGVSHAIGTGGRDLHAGVGGVTTLQALDLLAHDDATRAIVLVSKPADDGVADAVLKAASSAGKPVIACLLGWRGTVPGGVRAAPTLEDAAMLALHTIGMKPRRLVMSEPGGSEVLARAGDGRRGVVREHRSGRAPLGDGWSEERSGPPPASRPRPTGHRNVVHGLFAGGTLCAEAREIVGDVAGPFVDFGSAEFTEGRPHPMIDPELRNRAIAAAGRIPHAAVVLIDVVLGHCAHPDPAGAAIADVTDALDRARRAKRSLHVVAHVVGTDDDPQQLSAQERVLRDAGVIVCPSNRIAALTARELAIAGGTMPRVPALPARAATLRPGARGERGGAARPGGVRSRAARSRRSAPSRAQRRSRSKRRGR